MIGPGIAMWIVNVLPFSYFFTSFFVFRRYNLIGVFPTYNRRTYYRQWWVRTFFGRTQYTAYITFGSLYAVSYYKQIKGEDELYSKFTTAYEEFENYDEEKTPSANEALLQAKHKHLLDNTRISLLEYRAKKNHDLKIEAFNQFAEEYERSQAK